MGVELNEARGNRRYLNYEFFLSSRNVCESRFKLHTDYEILVDQSSASVNLHESP